MPTPFRDTLLTGQLLQASHWNQFGPAIQNLESGITHYQVALGTANAYQVHLPAPLVMAVYNAGLPLYWLCPVSNTGPATLQVLALDPQPIVKNGSVPLAGGELSQGQVICVIYDGSQFQLIGATVVGVSSFSGRHGLVVPVAGDYAVGQVSGVAAAAQGGTGFSSFSPGDLLTGSGTGLARLPVGAPGQVLTATAPLNAPAWSNPPAFPAPYLRPAYSVPIQGPNSPGTLGVAVCPDSDPPLLAVLSNGVTQAFFMERRAGRWTPVGASGLGINRAGDTPPYTLPGPLNTNPAGILYVPTRAGGGPGTGKFWIPSTTNEYVRVVSPYDLAYTDYPIGTSANAGTKIQGLVYSPDRNQVFALMGGGTRVVCIDADTVTQVSVGTGNTLLEGITLQVDGGVTQKVWVTRAVGTSSLFWFDPVTLAGTDVGYNPGVPLRAVTYVSEVGCVFVSNNGGTVYLAMVSANAPYAQQALYTRSSDGPGTYRLAYVPAGAMVVFPINARILAFDRATFTPVANVDYVQWNIGPTLYVDAFYDPTFREFYFTCGDHLNGIMVAT